MEGEVVSRVDTSLGEQELPTMNHMQLLGSVEVPTPTFQTTVSDYKSDRELNNIRSQISRQVRNDWAENQKKELEELTERNRQLRENLRELQSKVTQYPSFAREEYQKQKDT